MFRELRNSPITLDEAEKILKDGVYGYFATTGIDGYPYGVPINYVYMNNCIYVHGSKIGHRIDNIKFNQSVSFCVVDSVKVLEDKFDTLFRSTILFGKAELVEEEDEKRMALMALLEKYSSNYMEKGLKYMSSQIDNTSVVRISIKYMTGKAQK